VAKSNNLMEKVVIQLRQMYPAITLIIQTHAKLEQSRSFDTSCLCKHKVLVN